MRDFKQSADIYLLLGLILVTALSLTAAAQTESSEPDARGLTVFYIDDPMNRNTATFESEAPLEDIVGTTNIVTGTLHFNPAKPQNGGTGHIRVPVASIETGIPLRDEHLRSADWLNADEYPYIELEITKVKDVEEVKSNENSASYDVTVVGLFSVNGNSREIEIPARISYLKESDQTRQRRPGDLLAARAEFTLALQDYGITGPSGKSLIGSKVGEEIAVEVTILASSVPPQAEAESF